MAFHKFTINVQPRVWAFLQQEEERLGVKRAEIVRAMFNEIVEIHEARAEARGQRKRKPTEAPRDNGQMTLDCSSS